MTSVTGIIDHGLSDGEREWDAFVAGHPQSHLLQTSRWSRLKSEFGWTACRAVVRAGESKRIVAGASMLFRRLPWGQTVAYVPKGPLVDWEAPGQAEALLDELRRLCRERRAALLKIEPDLPASDVLASRLASLGFRPSTQRVQPLSTIWLDVHGDDETLLGRMKPKWRYNIRLAERKGVTVRSGTFEDLPAIQRLIDTTGVRDGFGVHSGRYYATATQLFVPPGMARWLVAEHESRPDGLLAAIAVFAIGRASWYMWGASGDEGRNLMPNHALQWEAMRWAREKGCLVYDLWGIPDEVGEKPEAYAEPESWGEGGLWGVYRFKQGFGGQVVRFAGAWDLQLSGPGYALYNLALHVRRSQMGG